MATISNLAGGTALPPFTLPYPLPSREGNNFLVSHQGRSKFCGLPSREGNKGVVMAAISKQSGYEPSFRAGSCPLVGDPPR